MHCGQPSQAPRDLSFEDGLVWALEHPDGGRAVMAAQTLGARRIRSALPALRRVVEEHRDPYLAVTALRSAIQIAGSEELGDWLLYLAHSDSFMVRELAQHALSA